MAFQISYTDEANTTRPEAYLRVVGINVEIVPREVRITLHWYTNEVARRNNYSPFRNTQHTVPLSSYRNLVTQGATLEGAAYISIKPVYFPGATDV